MKGTKKYQFICDVCRREITLDGIYMIRTSAEGWTWPTISLLGQAKVHVCSKACRDNYKEPEPEEGPAVEDIAKQLYQIDQADGNIPAGQACEWWEHHKAKRTQPYLRYIRAATDVLIAIRQLGYTITKANATTEATCDIVQPKVVVVGGTHLGVVGCYGEKEFTGHSINEVIKKIETEEMGGRLRMAKLHCHKNLELTKAWNNNLFQFLDKDGSVLFEFYFKKAGALS